MTYIYWLRKNTLTDFKTILRNIFTLNSLKAVKEVFSESLLHRRIFRYNPRLGYMHMSLAFGWFLLIVVGKIETMLFTHDGFNPPYLPVFFKYFYPNGIPDTFKGNFFLTVMDLLLIFVLSGLAMAIIKRFRSKALGMKQTTKHILPDRIALTFLWFIFPVPVAGRKCDRRTCRCGRILYPGNGESAGPPLSPGTPVTAFLVGLFHRAGGIFHRASVFAVHAHLHRSGPYLPEALEPGHAGAGKRICRFRRSMPVRGAASAPMCASYRPMQVYHHSQAVYFLRDVRYGLPERPAMENCFLCGRCTQACPVDIGIDPLRLATRKKEVDAVSPAFVYHPLPARNGEQVEVLYFAGCMSRLTPGIIEATREILTRAGIRFSVLDDQEEICCGRPAMQAGFDSQARSIISRTSDLINRTGASMLLVTCPICYKVFREEYQLTMPVVHHTEFLEKLMLEKPHLFRKGSLRMSYHDPCDLGRGSGIYDSPRNVLRKTGTLVSTAHEREDSLCCGGSLANLAITPAQRALVTDSAFQVLAAGQPDYIVTSCPLCKKTFSAGKREIPVADIAEIARMMLVQPEEVEKIEKDNLVSLHQFEP